MSITANDGYFVTNAMIGETAIENFENFIIPAEINKTILTAEFSKYSYSVRIIETGASTFSEFIFEHGEQPKIRINSSDNGEIESVKLNGVNITEEVTGNNYLQLTPIRENTTLVINPTKVNVDVNEMTASGINYWSVSNSLFIESEQKMASLEIYDTSGRKVLSDSNNGYSFVAKLPSSQVYLATVMFDDNSTETIKVNIAN